MPPNKIKLYKTHNKNAPKLKGIVRENSPSIQATSSTSEIPNQGQFEIELCWCIQQLQKALDSGKLNIKQVQEHTKSLNVLMSNTAIVVKKRQVMRLSFGDYREKMAAEERKISKNAATMKLKPATPNKKTVFLKKSPFSSNVENSFRFNFTVNAENDTRNSQHDINNSQQQIQQYKSENFQFTPSNNSFRFGFNIENDV